MANEDGPVSAVWVSASRFAAADVPMPPSRRVLLQPRQSAGRMVGRRLRLWIVRRSSTETLSIAKAGQRVAR